jgi:GT2 family glycosyltransferase
LRSLDTSPAAGVYWLQNESRLERTAFNRLEAEVGDGVNVYRSAQNLGAAGGKNYVAEKAIADGHDWLALCDNDIVVGIDTFSRIVGQTPPGVAVSGCVTSNGGMQAWGKVNDRHTGLMARPRKEPILVYDERLRARGATRWEPLKKTVAFSLVMVPVEAWRSLGPLDDSFGVAFGEDNDWCHRARVAGWKVGYTTEVAVHHDHGGSTTPAMNRELRGKAVQAFKKKWGRLIP